MDEPRKSPKESPWSDERVELLKKLHAQGDSFSQIAAQLGGGITRNAAIGKAKRIGLEDRCKSTVQRQRYRALGQGQAPASPKPPKVKKEPGLANVVLKRGREDAAEKASAHPPRIPKAVEPKPQSRALVLAAPTPRYIEDDPEKGRYTVRDLSDAVCRWPVGDLGSPDFCFCGHTPREKSPYCEYHARGAYQPMQDRRHRSFG